MEDKIIIIIISNRNGERYAVYERCPITATFPRSAIAKVSRLRVRRDGRPVVMEVQRDGGTTEIGSRGGRAIGRNSERATEVAEMERRRPASARGGS